MGGRKLLFSELRQQMFELNDTAAYLACRLEEGISHDALIDDLCRGGEDREAMAAAIKPMLLAWSREGIAVADLAPADGADWPGQSIAMAGTEARLRYATPRLAAALTPLFAHLETPPSRRATIYYAAASPDFAFIGRVGEPARIVTHGQMAPAFKALLVAGLLNETTAFTALHSACLVSHGKALLLCGSPGAGKSTLAAALDAAGFEYDGDDITLLDRSGRVQGVPFAFTAKAGSWPLITRFRPEIRSLAIHQRFDERRVRYLPAANPAEAGWKPLGWIIKLRREAGAPAALHPRNPADALSDLMEEAWSRSGHSKVADMHMLVGIVSNALCHELVYSDLDDAVGLLKRICRDG